MSREFRPFLTLLLPSGARFSFFWWKGSPFNSTNQKRMPLLSTGHPRRFWIGVAGRWVWFWVLVLGAGCGFQVKLDPLVDGSHVKETFSRAFFTHCHICLADVSSLLAGDWKGDTLRARTWSLNLLLCSVDLIYFHQPQLITGVSLNNLWGIRAQNWRAPHPHNFIS